MTEGDWNKSLAGDGDREIVVKGEHTKVRYLVADAIRAHAKSLAKDRPDRAALLRHIAGKISAGYAPTKAPLFKAAKELAVIKKAVVDGKKLVSG